MISRLGEQGDLSVVIRILLDCLSNDNSTGIASVCKVHSLFMQIDNDNCASAQHTIESLLFFKSLLNLKEACDKSIVNSLLLEHH